MSNNLSKCEPSKRFLFELIFNGATMKTICKVTGRGYRYIMKKLKENDLPTPQEYKKIFKQTTLREMWKYRIAVEYMRLNGLNNIASKTPFDWKGVKNILNEMGILTDLHLGAHLMKKRLKSGWQPLPLHLQQVLEGELLGDGYLSLTDTAPSFKRITNEDDIINALDALQWFSWVDVDTELEKLQASISLFNTTRETLSYLSGAYYSLEMALYSARWVEFVAAQFRENGYYVNIYPTKWVDKNGVEHPQIALQTESSLNLSIELLRWYGLVKGIPWDFEYTPISLLHHFIGDGSFNMEITLATSCFHWNEVEFLVGQIRQKVGVKARIEWRPSDLDCPSNPNRNWIIVMPTNRSSRTRFFDYLSMAPGIKVARQIFPWKFSRDIKKEDCV